MDAAEAVWEQIWQTISQSVIRHNKPKTTSQLQITVQCGQKLDNNKSELCTKCYVEVGGVYSLCLDL